MNKPAIIFIPYHIRHWDMYLPLVEPLESLNFKVVFIMIDGFHYVDHKPQKERINKLEIIKINLSVKGERKAKREEFKIIRKELLPVWRNYISHIDKGVIIATDYMAIHRMMIKAVNNPRISIATLQDGHYAGLPRKYGWDLENSYRKNIKRILINTPFKKYINLAFGACANHLGLYGETIKKRLINEAGFDESRLTVVGSPRHAIFSKRIDRKGQGNKVKDFSIYCFPTTFPLCHDNQLYESQDQGLLWVLDAIRDLDKETDIPISFNIKVKYGYDDQVEHYKKLLDHPSVKIIEGTAKLEELFSAADLIITTGSTAGMEAAVCGIPVMQIAPDYLKKKITFIANLPVASSYKEVLSYLQSAILENNDFFNKYCLNAYEELADIKPEWDSIHETASWIHDIATAKI